MDKDTTSDNFSLDNLGEVYRHSEFASASKIFEDHKLKFDIFDDYTCRYDIFEDYSGPDVDDERNLKVW